MHVRNPGAMAPFRLLRLGNVGVMPFRGDGAAAARLGAQRPLALPTASQRRWLAGFFPRAPPAAEDEARMRVALEVARAAGAAGEVPVGALVVLEVADGSGSDDGDGDSDGDGDGDGVSNLDGDDGGARSEGGGFSSGGGGDGGGGACGLHGVVAAARGNAVAALRDAAAHAELRALRAACEAAAAPSLALALAAGAGARPLLRRRRRRRLDGATLYATVEPCLMCMGACLLHRVRRVVFGARSPVFGALALVPPPARPTARPLQQLWPPEAPGPTYNHRVLVQGGVCADEAAALMQGFFAGLRQRERSR